MKGLLNIFPLLALLFHAAFAEDPILSWIEEGNIEGIEEYLQDHDINGVYGDSETTMLVHAIVYGTPKTTAWLIKKGANVNQAVDSEDNTSIFYASLNGNLKIAKVLVKQGADLWHKNKTGETAYDLAV
nr:hypothetical protein [Spirochaeta sp.]